MSGEPASGCSGSTRRLTTAHTLSRHSALLTNVVADDAAGEAGFCLPRLPCRRIDKAGAPVPLPGRFFYFSATAGKPIPCDAHHCAPGCVGLTFHPTSTAPLNGTTKRGCHDSIPHRTDDPHHHRHCVWHDAGPGADGGDGGPLERNPLTSKRRSRSVVAEPQRHDGQRRMGLGIS